MSSNETDAFDNLMNEFTNPAEASPGVDTPAPAEETPEEVSEEPVEEQEEAEGVEDSDESEGAEEASEGNLEDTPEEEPKPKGKKSAQERISEVVAKQRQAERERDAERAEKAELLRRLQELEAAVKPQPKAEPSPVSAGEKYGLVEPTADDVDDNGEPKYPLGEFDPKFMRDVSRYDRAVERAYEQEIAEKNAKQAAALAEDQRLFDAWALRLNEAEKTSPQIREKAQMLVDTFSDADPQHMQTLAKTIMQLDNGPSVLEYLADNLDEADRLVKMGTNSALLQLGRLDGLFVESTFEELPPVKPTAAPRPPAALSRGSGAKASTSLYDKMLKDFR